MTAGEKLGRREVLRRSLVVLAVAPIAAPIMMGCGPEELRCSGSLTPAQLQLRSTIQYMERAVDPARRCSGCQLFTGTPTTCGTCSVVPGSIHPQGSCASFVARS